MTTIVIAIKDNGAVVKVEDIRIESAEITRESQPPVVFQLHVNGMQLTNDESQRFLTRLSNEQPRMIVGERHRQVLQDTMLRNLPSPTAFPSQGGDNWRWDAFVEFSTFMDHYGYETFGEMVKHISNHRLSSGSLNSLHANTGNRAFRRELLTRMMHRDLAQFVFNEQIGILAYVAAEFGAQINAFENEHPGRHLTIKDAAMIGGEVGVKVYSLLKICDSTWFTKAFAFAEARVHQILTYGASRLGIGSVHPLIATGIVVLSTTHLIYEHWDAIWDATKGRAKDFTHYWNYLNISEATPLRHNLLKSSVLVPNFQPALFTSANTALEPPREQTVSIVSTPHGSLVEDSHTMDVNNRIPLFFLENHLQLYPYFNSLLAKKNLEAFSRLMHAEHTETDLQVLQRAFREIFTQQQTRRNFIYDLPPQFYHIDDTPIYRPGERGTLVINNDGGRLNYAFKVDPIKGPQFAFPLIALHLIASYIRWNRLSPGDKAMAIFADQLENLQAARDRNWQSFPVFFRLLTLNDFDEIEGIYRDSVRNEIKNVIETHANDPAIVATFKGVHFALETNHAELYRRQRHPDYKPFVQDSERDLNVTLQRFDKEIAKNDLDSADKTVQELIRYHPYDVGTHLADAHLRLRQNNLDAAHTAIKDAEKYDQQERCLAECMPARVVEDEHGIRIDLRAASVNFAEAQHEQLNNMKFRYYAKRYQDAKPVQRAACLQDLDRYTQSCITENPTNTSYLNNRVESLVMSGRSLEAIPLQQQNCAQSKTAENYYRLGNINLELNHLTAANIAYESGLALSQHNIDSKVTYDVNCLVRNNYLKLAREQIELNELEQAHELTGKALKSAQSAKNDKHSHPADEYWFGVLCLSNDRIKDGQEALEKFVNQRSTENKTEQNTEQELLYADAYCKLGTVYASNGLLDKSQESFTASLKIDGECVEALVGYGRVLFATGNLSEAEQNFRHALRVDNNSKQAQDGLRSVQNYRVQCLTYFGEDLGLTILSFCASEFITHADLAKNTRKNLQIVKTACHLVYGFARNWQKHGQFIPSWEKMKNLGRAGFVANKICIAAQIVEQLVDRLGGNISDPWRNGLQTVRATAEVASIAHILTNTVWADEQIFIYLGEASPYVYGAALLLACGFDIVEAGVRGSYRLIFGEYAPRVENRAYHFTKHFTSSVGAVSLLCLSHPHALAVMYGGAKAGAGYVLAYMPNIPITPEQVAICGAIVAGTAVVAGLGAYAYNQAWYSRLNTMQQNAYELAEKKEFDASIKKYRACLELKPDISVSRDINRNISAVSRNRLIVAINQIKSEKSVLNTEEYNKIIAAHDVHLKEVGVDYECENEKKAWQLEAYNHECFKSAAILVEQNNFNAAIDTYKVCLEKNREEKTRNNIQQNIAIVSERRLIFMINKINHKESKDPDVPNERKELTMEDLQQLIVAYQLHLNDVPNDKKRTDQLTDLELIQQTQKAFQQGEYLQGLLPWEKYLERHPEDKIQKDEYSKTKCILYTQDTSKHAEAMQMCLARLQDNDKDTTALRCRAQLYLAAGKTHLARQDAQQLQQLDPEDPTVYQQLASIEHTAGNLLLAKEFAKKALDLHEQRKSASEHMTKTKAHIAAIESDIISRWVHSLSQCATSVLYSFVEYLTTPIFKVENPFMSKPPLPYFQRCTINNTSEHSTLSVIGEQQTKLDDIDAEKPDLFSIGDRQFGQEEFFSASGQAIDANSNLVATLSVFVRHQQFWQKSNTPPKQKGLDPNLTNGNYSMDRSEHHLSY